MIDAYMRLKLRYKIPICIMLLYTAAVLCNVRF